MTRLGASLAALLTTLGVAVLAAPGAEAAAGRCDPGTGVTVVVDFGPLGRGTQIGCDPGGAGDKASQVVPAAGFSLSYVNGQPFVCRIEGLPDPNAEQCAQTPPANAYWGLFWNDGKGGGWVYSSQGVATLEVPAGGSIGWRFQDGGGRDLPGASPNPPAPDPEPSPTNGGGNGGGGGGGNGGDGGSAGDGGGSSTPSAAPSTSAAASASASPKASKKPDQSQDDGKKADDTKADDEKQDRRTEEKDETTAASPTPSESPTDDVTVATEPASSSTGDSGSDGWLFALAGVAVLGLGGAAGFMAWRRRA